MNFHDSGLTPQTLFSRANLWQSWLDVEAEMAQAQAEIGMIPQWAADEISDKARLELFDTVALERSVAETMAPIVSLVRALTSICGEAGRFVHWGGTTQNIMSTGRVLLVRRSHDAMLSELASSIDQLGKWADLHATTIMAGRTNNRHALPITFGFKVAGWVEELVRQSTRFRQVEQRVFALYFGGAIGAGHSFDGRGAELSKVLARRLGLSEVLAPSRASLDTLAEYVTTLGLFGMGVGRIGSELYRLMSEEVGEVSEMLGADVIGSSTMPHKVNPKHVVNLIASAAQLRAKVAPALEAGLPAHEGDASCNQLMSATLEEACELGWELSRRLASTLSMIEIHPENMQRNLGLSATVIASENVMMVLAPKIGRTRAHDLVHHALADAMAGGAPIIDSLLANGEVHAVMTHEELQAALAPENYLGDSVQVAQQASALARQTAAELTAK